MDTSYFIIIVASFLGLAIGLAGAWTCFHTARQENKTTFGILWGTSAALTVPAIFWPHAYDADWIIFLSISAGVWSTTLSATAGVWIFRKIFGSWS